MEVMVPSATFVDSNNLIFFGTEKHVKKVTSEERGMDGSLFVVVVTPSESFEEICWTVLLSESNPLLCCAPFM